MDVEYVLTQASSATIAPVGRFAFRNLKAFPTQTFLESVQIQVPAVKAETRFLMRWQSAEGKVLGTTDLLAYPPSKFLLQQLKPLSGGEPLGVFDPAGELKQLLQNAGTEFADCQRQELANFTGKLLILGPFKSRDEMQGFTKKTVLNLAMKGTSIVWLQPPPDRHSELQPSFQKMQFGKGAVVLVQQDFLPDLAANPESQSRLLQLCTTAVCPREHDPFQLLHSNN